MNIARRLDAIREKPHHVRRQVAFGVAGAITAVIALAWLSLSLYTGAFAIKGSSFAELTGAAQPGQDSGAEGAPAVAGAAAAPTDPSGPPALQVVSGGDAGGGGAAPAAPAGGSASDPQAGQNIIPF